MKRIIQIAILASFMIAGFVACAADLTVFAAASLTDSLKQIGADYEKASGQKVVFNFEGSSALARQIAAGAPADIFFSADEAQMNRLDKKGLLLKGTRKNRLSNSLVIVIPSDSALVFTSPTNFTDASIKKIALADPKAVPAGVYAREYLQKLHLWKAVEPKVVPTQNVRAALAAVESGNVEAGMVFKTDAAISKKVKVAYEVPRKDGPEINYPMAVVKDSPNAEVAKVFLDYLDSEKAGAVFERYGFVLSR